MLSMAYYAFLIISVHKILNFGHFSQKHYRHTDRRTDRRTDTPSYRNARTHLKKKKQTRVRTWICTRPHTHIQMSSNHKMLGRFLSTLMALTKLRVQMGWNFEGRPTWAKLADSSRRFWISALEAKKWGFMFLSTAPSKHENPQAAVRG